MIPGYSRHPQVLTLAAAGSAGSTMPLRLNADWFVVHKLQANDETGADVEIEMAVNGGAFAPVKRGEPGHGVTPGQAEIKLLQFRNTTGAPVFLRVIHGVGGRPYSPETKVDGGSVELGAATISALINSIELKLKIQSVNPGAGAVTYSNCKALEVIAVGNSGAVTITTPSGTNFPLPAGAGKEFACETDSNHLEPITVTPDANCGFEVTALYF